jgi:hypothetical protein
MKIQFPYTRLQVFAMIASAIVLFPHFCPPNVGNQAGTRTAAQPQHAAPYAPERHQSNAVVTLSDPTGYETDRVIVEMSAPPQSVTNTSSDTLPQRSPSLNDKALTIATKFVRPVIKLGPKLVGIAENMLSELKRLGSALRRFATCYNTLRYLWNSAKAAKDIIEHQRSKRSLSQVYAKTIGY